MSPTLTVPTPTPETVRVPTDSDRLSIIGKTGSGKTVAALAHLSVRSYTTQPWIIYNFKNDRHINAIRRAIPLRLPEVPDKPGLYVVNPRPGEGELLNMQFNEIWERGFIGLYIDEGYMVGNRNENFRAILTQGRSKYIPVIMLMQRPVFVDRFLLSESEFLQVFWLNHRKDRAVVEEYVPQDLNARLPKYHSYYYDVDDDSVFKLKPVPPVEEILNLIDERLYNLEERERQKVVMIDTLPQQRKVRAI